MTYPQQKVKVWVTFRFFIVKVKNSRERGGGHALKGYYYKYNFVLPGVQMNVFVHSIDYVISKHS